MGLSAGDINSSGALQGAFQTGLAEVLGISVGSVGGPVASPSGGGGGGAGAVVTVTMIVTSSYAATTVQSMVIASLMSGSLTRDIAAAAVAQGYQGDLSSFQVIATQRRSTAVFDHMR